MGLLSSLQKQFAQLEMSTHPLLTASSPRSLAQTTVITLINIWNLKIKKKERKLQKSC